METKQITFKEALKILDIEDYEERIFGSNSRGELYHLQDYINLAKFFKDYPTAVPVFKKHFEETVEDAYKNWERPQSVFQHLKEML
jgi:hypothetical protein